MAAKTVLLLILAAAAVAAAVLIGRRLWWQRRAEAWQRAAGRLGLAWNLTPTLTPEANALHTFSRGHNHRMRAGVEGTAWDATVLLADYQYTVGYGRNRSVHRQTVCVLRGEELNLPNFFMRPERALIDRIGELFGVKDFDFDDDPAYSRAFVLAGDDEEAVRATFNPSVRSRLMHLGEPRLRLEGSGRTLVVHHGHLVDPANAGELQQQAVDVAAMLRN